MWFLMRIHAVFREAFLCFWLLLLFSATFCYGEEESTVEVVGIGECADCAESNIMTSQALSDYKPEHENGLITKGGELDEEGTFKVNLPCHLVEDGKLKEECYGQLHSASAAPCPTHSGMELSNIILNHKTNEKYIFWLAGKLKFSPVTCASDFLWLQFKYVTLTKLPKLKIPPLKSFGLHHPYLFPPKGLPPWVPSTRSKPIYKSLSKFFSPLVPTYQPSPKVLPPPVPTYKPPPKVFSPPAPIYKQSPMVVPPPVLMYSPPPKVLSPPAPVYKQPPKVLPPPVPIYKPPSEVIPPPAPIYKQPPKVLPPPIPIYKPPPKVIPPPVPITKPLHKVFPPLAPFNKPQPKVFLPLVPIYKPSPIPIYNPKPPIVYKPFPPIPKIPPIQLKPCPPLSKLPPLTNIPPKHFHHPKFGKKWPSLPPYSPSH